eukprot:s469_g1.t1
MGWSYSLLNHARHHVRPVLSFGGHRTLEEPKDFSAVSTQNMHKRTDFLQGVHAPPNAIALILEVDKAGEEQGELVLTALVRSGRLVVGQFFVVGTAFGRITNLSLAAGVERNRKWSQCDSASVGVAVQLTGLRTRRLGGDCAVDDLLLVYPRERAWCGYLSARTQAAFERETVSVPEGHSGSAYERRWQQAAVEEVSHLAEPAFHSTTRSDFSERVPLAGQLRADSRGGKVFGEAEIGHSLECELRGDAAMTTAEEFKEIGNDHFKRQEFDLAVAAYNKAIELNPQDCAFWLNRSNAYRQQSCWELAEEDAQEALRLSPGNAKALYGSAMCLRKLEQLPAALKRCEEGIQLHPENKAFRQLHREVLSALVRQQAREPPTTASSRCHDGCEGDIVNLDVVCYNEPPVGFPLRQARSGDVEDWRGGGGEVRRFAMDLRRVGTQKLTGECTCTGWPDNCFDEPKINPKVDGVRQRFSWGVIDDNGMLRLTKQDHETHEVFKCARGRRWLVVLD